MLKPHGPTQNTLFMSKEKHKPITGPCTVYI